MTLKQETITYLGPWANIAKSLVIFPDSIVPMQEDSRVWTNSNNFWFPSSWALQKNSVYFLGIKRQIHWNQDIIKIDENIQLSGASKAEKLRNSTDPQRSHLEQLRTS